MVTDGSSNTLLIGERPPSNWFDVGWWYAGVGFDQHSGIGEHTLGIYESHREMVSGIMSGGARRIRFRYPNSSLLGSSFWSMHVGGANLRERTVLFNSFHLAQPRFSSHWQHGTEANQTLKPTDESAS